MKSFKPNIEKIKTTAVQFLFVFVFAVAGLILYNTFIINSDNDLSQNNKHLKHLMSDHNVNNSNFDLNFLAPVNKNLVIINSDNCINSGFNNFDLFPKLIKKMWLNSPSFKNYTSISDDNLLRGYSSTLIQPPKLTS